MNLIIQNTLPLDTPPHPQAEQDYVELEWYEAGRHILRKTTTNGRDISFRMLQEGQRLKHGDIVYSDTRVFIRITIKPCAAIVIAPKNLPDMARACYEIGNKHSPLFLEGDELTMPYDKPMFLWLEAAGFQPQQAERRLSLALRANSAPGFGGHHSHSHGHGHDH